MRSVSRVLFVCACVVSAVVPAAASAQATGDAPLLTELAALERASWEATVRDDKEFFRGSMAPEFKGFFAEVRWPAGRNFSATWTTSTSSSTPWGT